MTAKAREARAAPRLASASACFALMVATPGNDGEAPVSSSATVSAKAWRASTSDPTAARALRCFRGDGPPSRAATVAWAKARRPRSHAAGCASPLGGTAAESWRRAARGEESLGRVDPTDRPSSSVPHEA